VHGDGPYSGLVKELFVVPVRVIGFQLASSEVVIPKPDNSPRQQERVFITSGISDLWTIIVNKRFLNSQTRKHYT